ncbi:multidrug ABC transporter ATP-binding protein [Tersicoccus solisilvae]|uniref:Multidrug ABC transporter ATP-binding protein n=1 Tax=Tersicoccus solisilvae TaxID=1882339 RepID=A0ABQ1NL14_9MICC|nr:ABC transporter ATP-binding protein [Tersicoccus solisilvae]GGC79833.1 multidrug ABC transporter ATP-binding protein [Tersicoccus solisilvae]
MTEAAMIDGLSRSRGPGRVDPADAAHLAESPVSLRRVAGLFRPHAPTLAVVFIIIAIASVVGLAQPFLVKEVIDVALPRQDVGVLLWCVGGMLVVAVVTALLGVWQTYLSTAVGERVMHRLRTDVFAHVQRQSLAFFTRTRSGEVQSRLTHDISGMQSVFTTTATSIAANLTTAVATAAAMVALSWQLSLISLVVIPPAVWLSRRVALLRRDVTTQTQRHLALMHSQVEEKLSVSGARLAKTLGTTARDTAAFAATSERLVDLDIRSQLAGRWRMATMSIVFSAIPAVLYLVAGLPATSGAMTIGTLVAFIALQTTIFRPIMSLLNVGVQWVSSMALFSRIFGYLDLPVEIAPPEHPVPLDPAAVRGEVRFEGVNFAYGPGRPVLSGIDLTVPAGGSLALVGHTGAGKSTLASLVPRLQDVDAGAVTIDGVDVRDLAPETLAAIVGVVSQETYLIHDTIRANLLLAAPEATESELWDALGTARLSSLVAALPQGLDTVVGARGHRFSGGEQQRLAIARTVLRDPRVLVLDEATSALDNDTEREVLAALDALADGRTTISIAHRLTTVQAADQIAVLDGGRVVEHGTHADLLDADGAYARLVHAAERDPARPAA